MRSIIALLLLLCSVITFAQPGKKPEPPPPAEFGVLYKAAGIPPKKIKPAFYNPATLALNNPLSLADALATLYPGAFYRIPDPNVATDTFTLTEWNCPSCPSKLLNGWIVGEKLRFPLADDNQTRWKDTLHFTDDSGRQNLFISFSTTANQEGEDFIPSGRFSCAFMGLAWFMLQNNRWQLKAFSPVVGCFGAFQTLPPIRLIKLGAGNYGCMLMNANGGAGGPYFGDLHVFAPVKKQFHTVLSVNNAECANAGPSGWGSVLTAVTAGTFGALTLVLDGKYRKADFDITGMPRSVPAEIKAAAAQQDSVVFKITRSYKFEKGKYAQKQVDVQLN